MPYQVQTKLLSHEAPGTLVLIRYNENDFLFDRQNLKCSARRPAPFIDPFLAIEKQTFTSHWQCQLLLFELNFLLPQSPPRVIAYLPT